jgi:hypothetical protein
MRLARASRVDAAWPSAARGLPDFLIVSHAVSKADAKSAVVSASKAEFASNESIGKAVPYLPAGALPERQRQPRPALTVRQLEPAVGNLHYRSEKFIFLGMFWEGKRRRASEPTDNIHKMPSSGPADPVS